MRAALRSGRTIVVVGPEFARLLAAMFPLQYIPRFSIRKARAIDVLALPHVECLIALARRGKPCNASVTPTAFRNENATAVLQTPSSDPRRSPPALGEPGEPGAWSRESNWPSDASGCPDTSRISDEFLEPRWGRVSPKLRGVVWDIERAMRRFGGPLAVPTAIPVGRTLHAGSARRGPSLHRVQAKREKCRFAKGAKGCAKQGRRRDSSIAGSARVPWPVRRGPWAIGAPRSRLSLARTRVARPDSIKFNRPLRTGGVFPDRLGVHRPSHRDRRPPRHGHAMSPTGEVLPAIEMHTPLGGVTRRVDAGASLAHLRTRAVAIAGCGGIGGAASLLLTSLGVERFHLADPEAFAAKDMKLHWGAYRATLGINRAAAHEGMIRSIEPLASVRVFTEGVTDENIERFLEGINLLVDTLDHNVPAELRDRLHRLARAQRIPALTARRLVMGSIVAVSLPEGQPLEFSSVLSLASCRLPSNAVVVAFASSLACTEALMILADPRMPGWRPPVSLPRLWSVDLRAPLVRVITISEPPAGGDALAFA